MSLANCPISTILRNGIAAAVICLASGAMVAETNAPTPAVTNAPAATPSKKAEEASSSSARDTNAPLKLDYASFKMINERNIFNANRSRRNGREGRDKPKQAKVETFSLLGTMSYAKGDFAFFDGSSSSYRKAVKAHDKIAGYAVTDVLPNTVKLEADGKTLEMPVGAQMRREDEGTWELVASSVPKKNGSEKKADESSDSASGSDDEALKRLLQRREAEENK